MARRHDQVFGQKAQIDLLRLIEGRVALREAAEDPLDDLIGAAPQRVHEWVVRKAALADQTKPGLPLVPPAAALLGWKAHIAHMSGEMRKRRGPGRAQCALAHVALLRDPCGLTFERIAAERIAAEIGTSRSEARLDYKRHATLLCDDPEYAQACRSAATEALAAAFGRGLPPVAP